MVYFINVFALFSIQLSPPPAKKLGPRKMPLYFRIPFMRDNTNSFFKEEVKKVLSRYFPQIQCNAVFFNNYKIKNFTNHKEKLNFSFESVVVYEYTCPSCLQAYVGSSIQTISSRIADHKGVSIRTSQPFSRPSFSAIRSHCREVCDTLIKTDDFKILYRGKTETDIRIAESMLIKKLKPNLNNNLSSHPLLFYK